MIIHASTTIECMMWIAGVTSCLAVSLGPDAGSRIVSTRRLAQSVLRTGVHVISEQKLQHANIVHQVQRAVSVTHIGMYILHVHRCTKAVHVIISN